MRFLQGQFTTDYTALMAGSLLSVLPMLASSSSSSATSSRARPARASSDAVRDTLHDGLRGRVARRRRPRVGRGRGGADGGNPRTPGRACCAAPRCSTRAPSSRPRGGAGAALGAARHRRAPTTCATRRCGSPTSSSRRSAGCRRRRSAEYVTAMILAFAHRLPRAAEGQRRREWPSAAERWAWYMPGAPARRDDGHRRRTARSAAASPAPGARPRRRGDRRAARRGADLRPAEAPGVEVVTADRLDDVLAGAD